MSIASRSRPTSRRGPSSRPARAGRRRRRGIEEGRAASRRRSRRSELDRLRPDRAEVDRQVLLNGGLIISFSGLPSPMPPSRGELEVRGRRRRRARAPTPSRTISTYSRVRPSERSNGTPYQPSETCGPDSPEPDPQAPARDHVDRRCRHRRRRWAAAPGSASAPSRAPIRSVRSASTARIETTSCPHASETQTPSMPGLVGRRRRARPAPRRSTTASRRRRDGSSRLRSYAPMTDPSPEPISRTYRFVMAVCAPLVRWWSRLEASGARAHAPLRPDAARRQPRLPLGSGRDRNGGPAATPDQGAGEGEPVEEAGASRRSSTGWGRCRSSAAPAMPTPSPTAIERLRGGSCIGVFPEGTISRGKTLRARSGVGRLALEVPEATLVCVACTGTVDIVRFPKRPRNQRRVLPPRERPDRPGRGPRRTRAPAASTRSARRAPIAIGGRRKTEAKWRQAAEQEATSRNPPRWAARANARPRHRGQGRGGRGPTDTQVGGHSDPRARHARCPPNGGGTSSPAPTKAALRRLRPGPSGTCGSPSP